MDRSFSEQKTMLAAYRPHRALVNGLIHTGEGFVRALDHMGIPIVPDLEDLRTNLGAEPATRTQIVIHFQGHDTSFGVA
jgi:hypothetical protein